jgi:hypothetical protein
MVWVRILRRKRKNGKEKEIIEKENVGIIRKKENEKKEN